MIPLQKIWFDLLARKLIKKRKLIRWETSRMSPLRFFANYLPYTLDSQIYSEATLFLLFFFFLFFFYFLHLSDLFSSNPHWVPLGAIWCRCQCDWYCCTGATYSAKFTNQITENYQIHSEKVCSSQSAARIEENNNLLESTKFEYW